MLILCSSLGWVRSLCLSALPSTWRGNQDGYSCSSSALPLTGWRFCDALSDRCFSSGLLILCVSLPGPEAVLAWSRFYRFSDGSGLYSLPGLETLSYPVYCTCTAAEIFTCTADRSTPARPVFSSHPLYFGVFQIKISVFHSLLDPELSVPWQNDLTKMDPASASELRDFLARSNSRMDHQDEQRAVSNRAIQALVTQVSELTTQLQRLQSEPEQRPTASNPPAPTIPDQAGRVIEPRLPPPAFYSGEPQQCRSFLAKCSLYISLQPSSFPTEESKIAFVITLLSGRAALWGTTVWEQKLPCCASFQLFSEEIRKVFDRAASGREAARLLAELRQGDRSVTDFSIEFRTLAAECRWNSEAQWDMFFHGLADYVKDEIYALELPTSLDGLVSLAIRVDARLQQRGPRARRASAVNRLDHPPISYRDADVGFAEPEPMQMGRSSLSQEEKRRRRNEGLCLYCGAAGHIAAQCPVKARARQ